VLLPGGDSAFGVRYDGETRRFWALTNPDGTDRVGLFSSFTLRDWAFHAMPLEAETGRIQAFMWPDFQIDGDDLVSIYRTCYADQDGEPASGADLNYLLFKRIPDFRNIPADKEEGRLLAADTGNGCVRRYSYGTQNGWLFDDGENNLFASGYYAGQELTAPYGLALSGNTVYISENVAGGRVLAFSRQGRFQRVVHTFDSGSTPGALAVAEGLIYASDEATDQLWRIDPATSSASVWLTASGTGYALQELRGLACDGAGNLYLADRTGDAILRFNAAGELDGSVTLDTPEALLWDATTGSLLASAYVTPDIISINPSSWAVTPLLDNNVDSQRFCGLAIANDRLFFTSDALNRINRQEGPSTYTAADIRLSAPGQLLLVPQGAAVYPDAALGSLLLLK
jgi:streptogramin lyase